MTTNNETVKNTITIVNINNESNKNLVEKLRAKLGKMVDSLPLFAFQNGVEPIQYRFHEKQNRLFIEYPRFNMMTTPTAIFLYLKRIGESFPSSCYKIKKTDVKTILTVDEVNNYINETFDPKSFIESTITNETNVVIDNLKVGVLIKTLTKDNTTEKNTDPLTYNRLFDLIRSKFNTVADSGYLDLLNKTCVMMWETWSNPSSVNFEPKELKKEKAEKVKTTTPVTKKTTKKNETKENGSGDTVIKDNVEKVEKGTIPTFTPPTETPTLENVIKNEAKEVTEKSSDATNS